MAVDDKLRQATSKTSGMFLIVVFLKALIEAVKSIIHMEHREECKTFAGIVNWEHEVEGMLDVFLSTITP